MFKFIVISLALIYSLNANEVVFVKKSLMSREFKNFLDKENPFILNKKLQFNFFLKKNTQEIIPIECKITLCSKLCGKMTDVR